MFKVCTVTNLFTIFFILPITIALKNNLFGLPVNAVVT